MLYAAFVIVPILAATAIFLPRRKEDQLFSFVQLRDICIRIRLMGTVFVLMFPSVFQYVSVSTFELRHLEETFSLVNCLDNPLALIVLRGFSLVVH